MGSFNVTCSLTGEIISDGTDAVMVLMNKRGGRDSSLAIYPWDMFSPISVVFEGKYNSYGRLEDIKVFQSRQTVSEAIIQKATDYVFEDLKEKTTANYNGYLDKPAKNIGELMSGRDWGFAKKSQTAEILKALIDVALNVEKEQSIGTLNAYSKMFGREYQSIDDAQNHVKELEAKQEIKIVPISFIYFKKEAYLKLVNGYGATKDEVNEDIYAQIIQNERSQGLPPSKGERCVMLGEENYAGSNHPAYKLSTSLKDKVKKVSDREEIKKLENLFIQDLTLLNDFMMMTGNSWVPTMTVNEDIKYYGHAEALDFQRELLKKTPKKNNIKSI